MRIGILEDEVANLVAEIVHQPAFLDGIDLVESACDVETYGILCMAFLERGHRVVFFLWQQGEFLGCEPTLVAAAELYLVAIFLSLHTSHDRAEKNRLYYSQIEQFSFDLAIEHLADCYYPPGLRAFELSARSVQFFKTYTGKIFTDLCCCHCIFIPNLYLCVIICTQFVIKTIKCN